MGINNALCEESPSDARSRVCDHSAKQQRMKIQTCDKTKLNLPHSAVPRGKKSTVSFP